MVGLARIRWRVQEFVRGGPKIGNAFFYFSIFQGGGVQLRK